MQHYLKKSLYLLLLKIHFYYNTYLLLNTPEVAKYF